MSEYGKIIEIDYDKDIKVSSVQGNENAFNVKANELDYVGGTIKEVSYTIGNIDFPQSYVRKEDFNDGIKNNVVDDNGVLKLAVEDSSPITENADISTESGGSYTYREILFTIKITGKIVSVNYKAYSSGTYTFTLYNANKTQALGTKTASLIANVFETITFDSEISVEASTNYILRVDKPSSTKIYRSVPGTYSGTFWDSVNELLSNGTTYTEYAAMGFVYKTPQYTSSGNYTIVLSVNSINEAYRSMIEWLETKPDNTNVVVKTAILISDITEPTIWDTAVNGSAIENISQGDNLEGKYLWIKIELSTSDGIYTPEIHSFLVFLSKILNKSILLLKISNLSGFNKAIGEIEVSYDSLIGILEGAAQGSLPTQSWTESFTPVNLDPINNPSDIESINTTLTDLTISTIHINLEKGYQTEVLTTSLTELSIVFTHIDDINP